MNTFAGQYADLLLGGIDQAYVAPRAQKVIQLINSHQAALSGCGIMYCLYFMYHPHILYCRRRSHLVGQYLRKY